MLRHLCLITALAFVSSMCASAQDVSSACVRGLVVESNQPSPNVVITIRDLASGTTHSTESDPSGAFRLCGLTPGRHQVIARRNGLVGSPQEEDLTTGADLYIKIALVQKSPSPAEPSLVDLDRAADRAVSGTVGEDSVGISRMESVQEVRLSNDFLRTAAMPDAPSYSQRNRLHGQLYGYRGSSLANQTDVTPAAQLSVSQFGGALGGDLAHGSTSYFVSFDQYGIDRQRLLSNLAGQVGVGNTALLTDANVLASSAFTARMDHQFSQRDSAYLRFNRNETHGNSLKEGQDTNLPGIATGLNVAQQSVAAGNTVSLSPDTTNESRAQFISSDAQVPAGMGALGLDATVPTTRRNRVFEAANNIYRQVGGQSLRMGGDFLYNQMNISFMQASLGRIATGGPSLSQSGKGAGLFVQSERQLRPNLLVTTGIRYDVQALRGIKTDLNNFSPQLGFAWSPASSRTVIRGGFGMYYDRVPLPAFAGSDDPAVAANLARSVSIGRPGTGSFGDLGASTTVSPTIQNSYAEHASLQAEQQIGRRSVLSAEYQYVRGVQLAIPVQRTAALCASTTACNAGNEFTGQQVGSGAVSSYSGFSVAFAQQPVRWGNYKVSYTYSTADGSGTGANESYVNDEMRRVSFTGVLHTSLDSGSTLWQRMTHGFLLTGTTDYTNRSEFLGMNFINLNARLTKNLLVGPKFRLEGMVETFNMLQRTNASLAHATDEMGESASQIFSTYRRVATLQSPNGSQLGLRMTF